MRGALVRLHRWAGLATALFIGLAGLTGALLAFKEELEAWVNPRLFVVAAKADAAMIDPLLLRELVEHKFPQARVDHVQFAVPGASAKFFLWPRIDAAPAGHPVLDVDEVFFDPYTGDYLGGRRWGALIDGGAFRRENIVPFIWRLHESLALPHPWGKVFMGVVALVWTVDCFVGLALTLPGRRPVLSRWRTAWTLKRGASTFRRIFDLHRAMGLWCWLMLALFAWSSVMLNLRTFVYQPLMSVALRFDEPQGRTLPVPDERPRIGWQEARSIGRSALAQHAAEHGFRVDAEHSLWYRPAQGAYLYRSHSSKDVSRHNAASDVWIDGQTGEVVAVHLERDAAPGNLVSEWLRALHTGRVFGLPYRVSVALIGLSVVLLSGAGVWIWWKKQLARRHRKSATSR